MLYVATKSATFTPEEILKVLHMLQGSSDDKSTLYHVAITLLYYGLLRYSEVKMIKVKDVRVVSEQGNIFIEVNYMYQRKQRNKGFTYHIPSSFVPLFRKYLRQICRKTVEQGQLQFQKKLEFWGEVLHPK